MSTRATAHAGGRDEPGEILVFTQQPGANSKGHQRQGKGEHLTSAIRTMRSASPA